MPDAAEILRYTAFSDDPAGGNPAGVVLDARGLDEAAMRTIAADVGYSETAFMVARPGEPGGFDVRYFSPESEVPFCGHATVAAAVAWSDRHGARPLSFHTAAGVVQVAVSPGDGIPVATLTSVEPTVSTPEDADVDAALAALGWTREDLDPTFPIRVAYAGAHHLVLATKDRATLQALDYDFDALQRLSRERDWVTLQLVHRVGPAEFHARNPFPSGGVVEDPATGAAAAALGGYLRAEGLVEVPATVLLHQGDDMGRPSELTVDIGEHGGIRVSGAAVPIDAA